GGAVSGSASDSFLSVGEWERFRRVVFGGCKTAVKRLLPVARRSALDRPRRGIQARPGLADVLPVMDERRVRPRHLRQGRRLSDGTGGGSSQDEDGRVNHAKRYDASLVSV